MPRFRPSASGGTPSNSRGMSVPQGSGETGWRELWLSRLKRARLVLSVTAIALGGLWLSGVLGTVPALVALGAVVVAVACDCGRRCAAVGAAAGRASRRCGSTSG